MVLQSGFGNAGDVWSVAEAHAPAVQPGLAATNRVCSEIPVVVVRRVRSR